MIAKRILDFFISFLLFVCLLPLFVITSVLLTFNQKGSPFFIQSRPGLNGTLFNIYKFKTMFDYEKEDNQKDDLHRITFLGKFLRKTSIDELPQLLNVLIGDMSLVGPRPLLPEYLPLYNSHQKLRHNVKPGITGWAQINGRNAISWNEKFELDIWYVKNQSLFLDLKIILLTVFKLFKYNEVNLNNNITSEAFNGYN